MSGPMRHGRRAFTLIETLVAITILAIVGTMVMTGFTQTFKNKKRIEHDIDRYQVLTMALNRMARELSMAYVSAQINPNPVLQVVKTAFVGKDDRVDFTSFSHQRLLRNSHESDQNELGYFVTSDPDDPSKKVLARREQNRIDDDPLSGGKIMIMVENVDELKLSYLDPTSGQWLDSWDTTQGAMQPNRLPMQVKILLTVPDLHHDGETLTLGTRASLPLQFGLNPATYNP